MSMSVKQSDVGGIISAASKELEALFTQTLAKAEPPKEEDSPAEPSEPSVSASPEASADGGEAAPVSSEAPEAAPEGKMDAAPDSDESPAEDEGTPPLEAAEEAQSDEPQVPGALEVVYSSLSPELLKAHYVAIKKVIFAKHKSDMADVESAPEGQDAPPQEMGQANVPPSDDDVPEEGEPDIQKNEAELAAVAKLTKTSEEEQEMADLKKTEELLKEVNDLKEGFKQVQKVLELAFSRPERKAVTSLETMAKSESAPVLDAKQLREQATAITTDPEKLAKLTKSERDLLLGYFDGSVDASKISVILSK